MARTSSVTLGPMQEFVDSLVRSGRYASSSEVIRDSLRLLQEKEAASRLELLRQAIEAGDESQLQDSWDLKGFLRRMQQGSSRDEDLQSP